MLLSDLALALEEGGVGVRGETIFRSRLTEAPDQQVALLEYQGDAPDVVHDSPRPVRENPRVQVLCRATTYDAARALAEAAHAVLCGIRNGYVGSTYYQRVMALQSPFVLGRDTAERTIVACNYRVQKDPG